MNKTLKIVLLVLGIITFIEVQVCLFFIIKTNIDINKNQPSYNNQMNDRFNFNGNNMPNPPSGGFNDDISKDAITPGKDSKKNSSISDSV